MATTQYFGSKPVSDWTANGPAEEGHDFINQINEQKGKVAEQESKYNEAYGNIGTAQSAYDEAYKNQQNYSDLYKQAKADEEVEDRRSQYEKSLNSVNATAAAMNNLPSSINAGSNVVLNANQRNAALNNQMAKYQNTLDYWTRQNAGDLSMYQQALSTAQNLAGQNMAQEQAKVAQTMTNLQTQMNMANELYNQVIQERQIMRSIYGDMYDDEYRHMQEEIEAWKANLDAETKRYAQEQANYRTQLQIAAQKESDNISKYLGSGFTWNGSEWVAPQSYKNWNFGNGYSVQQLGNGQAAYYKDGQPISAGDFLTATGKNGANWDIWNDIWNNGVSTQGVGSDTVEAYSGKIPYNASNLSSLYSTASAPYNSNVSKVGVLNVNPSTNNANTWSAFNPELLYINTNTTPSTAVANTAGSVLNAFNRMPQNSSQYGYLYGY